MPTQKNTRSASVFWASAAMARQTTVVNAVVTHITQPWVSTPEQRRANWPAPGPDTTGAGRRWGESCETTASHSPLVEVHYFFSLAPWLIPKALPRTDTATA